MKSVYNSVIIRELSKRRFRPTKLKFGVRQSTSQGLLESDVRSFVSRKVFYDVLKLSELETGRIISDAYQSQSSKEVCRK